MGLIHKTKSKVQVQTIYPILFSYALTDIRSTSIAENAENTECQTQLHVEIEATFPDAPQQWTEENKGDFVEATYSTEVLCSWEDQTTAPQPEAITETATEIVASAEVDLEIKDFEGEGEVWPSIEEHGDAQIVVVSEETEAHDKSVQEESTSKPDLAVQAETPAAAGEGPISSSEDEEGAEEEPVLSDPCVSETAQGTESEKEACGITTWIAHPEVPCECFEPGKPQFYLVFPTTSDLLNYGSYSGAT